MITLVIGIIIGWYVTAAYYRNKDGECPRMALGYNCKGETCDHSYAAMQEIRKDFDR